MKIHTRLSLWYFSVSFIILLVFSLGTYLGMQRLLFRALDQELNILIDSIERNYDPFFNHFEDLLFSPDNSNRYLEHYIQIYNIDNHLIYASPMTGRVDLGLSLPGLSDKMSINRQGRIYQKFPWNQENLVGIMAFRVVCRKIFFNDRPIGWVVVGLPIQRIEKSMGNLLKVLFVSIILAVIMIATGGYILTGKALNPVDQITSRAREISSRNLNQRIEVYNPDDELGKLSLVLNDLLERLQKAFESQRQFLADAAHELKTPLTILRTHWENEINNSDISLDQKEKFVQDIETISRLSHLINNLLLLSQTEDVEINFNFAPTRLDEIIKEVVDDATILAEMKKQSIEIAQLKALTIMGDKMRLYQLLFNIIDNAIKYSDQEGKIWISLNEQNDHARIEIRDNGYGISKEDLSHVFERFYRIKKDRARITGGSGLGLAISKLIVDSHHGSIQVKSELGKGSVFTIFLPLLKNKEKV
jgi:signal transduction histidine kinase